MHFLNPHSLTPLIAVTLLACSTAEPESRTGELPSNAWMDALALEPSKFIHTMDTSSREGWIAFHEHDYERAHPLFDGESTDGLVARSRAAYRLFLLHEDMARIQNKASIAYLKELESRLPAEPGSDRMFFAGMLSACTGQPSPVEVGGLTTSQLQELDAMRGAGTKERTNPPDAPAEGSLAARIQAMRNPGQAGLPALKANATTPVIRELVRAGYYQDWPDPCAYHVLANFWKEQALEGFGSTWTEVAQGWAAAPVSSVLFSGAQNADERTSMASQAPEAWGTTSPLLPNLGQGTPPSNLNGQAAREQVRAMDAKLNQRRDDLLAQADADAAAWINDLHPFQRYRHDLLVARARLSLLAGNHDIALAHLEMARDVTERSVGHANSGSLFLLMAEAHLDQGRVREALDTLPHLEGHYSHIVGLRESIADLVILRGLDRQGDSKEN